VSPLTCAFSVERVTGIEPALSAWESVRFGLLYALTCGVGCPRVTVRDRPSPRLMARQAVVRPELIAASAEAGCQFRGEPDMTGVEVLGQGGVTSSPGGASRRLP
jgi:hypothetical protein